MLDPYINLRASGSLPDQYLAGTQTYTRLLEGNVKAVEAFCRGNPLRVRSEHLLVQLVTALPDRGHLRIREYRDLVWNSRYNLSNAFQLTSEVALGKPHSDVFFKGGGQLILSQSTPFNPEQAAADWLELRPIVMLASNSTDLTMPALDGATAVQSPQEYSVFTIDIPMLAVMYRAFRDAEAKAKITAVATVGEFIATYVLPNIGRSFLDTSIFNRCWNTSIALPNRDWPRRHAFAQVDPYAAARGVERGFAEVFEKGALTTIADYCNNIPLPFNKSGVSLMRWPDVVLNSYTLPVLLASRLKLYCTLGEFYRKTDQASADNVLRHLQRVRGSPLLYQFGLLQDLFTEAMLVLG